MDNARGLVVPSMNTLWYHYPQETRRALHGTPSDVQRKFAALDALGLVDDGMEMFLMPSRLAADPGFTPDFARRFSRLPFRTVHIGETEHDFLDAPGAGDDLSRLAKVLEQLNSPAIVIHAHHLQHNRPARAGLLRSRLPGTLVLVENNGFDHEWGGKASSMAAIFADCPDFAFCLDIVHVKDFQGQRLDDFLADGLGERPARPGSWTPTPTRSGAFPATIRSTPSSP